MASIPMTLYDLEGYFSCLKHTLQHVLSTICLNTNWEAYVACNFNCYMESEGFFKVTGIVYSTRHGHG